MPDTSPRLGLPFILPGQAQKHVTHNEALLLLDGLAQLVLEDIDMITPPTLPDEGAVYALGAIPQGDWAGQADQLAQWVENGWRFIAPQEGWHGWVRSDETLRVYQAGNWQPTTPELDNLDGVGIGTSADAVNRLAIASEASLFTHAGAGHQIKVNKTDSTDTASLLFQTGWSGRAEMGTSGTDDFAIKVSADGSSWVDALRVDADNGRVSGAAVQSNEQDDTSGRLMTVGAFGLGNSTASAPTVANLDDWDTPSGNWRFTNTTAGTMPPGFTGSFGQVLISRYNGTLLMQRIWRNNALGGTWWRTREAGGWNDWRRDIDSENLLGTVSQSGGVPTGAVIEQGSNASGDYVRFADGTQICTCDLASSVANGIATCTFAAGFASVPSVSATAQYSGGMRVAAITGATANDVDVRTSDMTGNESVTPGVHVHAIGRWY